MTTHTLAPDHTTVRPLAALRDARRWVRETPAPRWEGSAGDKVRYVGYVAGSVVVWTGLGLAFTAGFAEVLTGFVSLVG